MTRTIVLAATLVLVVAAGYATFFAPTTIGGKDGPRKPGAPEYTETLVAQGDAR
jgi:hypothetical protein